MDQPLFTKTDIPMVVSKAAYRLSGVGEGEGGDTISPAGEGEGGDSESFADKPRSQNNS